MSCFHQYLLEAQWVIAGLQFLFELSMSNRAIDVDSCEIMGQSISWLNTWCNSIKESKRYKRFHFVNLPFLVDLWGFGVWRGIGFHWKYLALHQRDVQSFAHPETPKTKRTLLWPMPGGCSNPLLLCCYSASVPGPPVNGRICTGTKDNCCYPFFTIWMINPGMNKTMRSCWQLIRLFSTLFTWIFHPYSRPGRFPPRSCWNKPSWTYRRPDHPVDIFDDSFDLCRTSLRLWGSPLWDKLIVWPMIWADEFVVHRTWATTCLTHLRSQWVLECHCFGELSISPTSKDLKSSNRN